MTNEFIHRNIHTSDAYETFFRSLQQNSLPRLVKDAYKFFGLPVLVTDANYHLVSMAPAMKIGVSIWDTLYEKHSLDDEIISDYQKMYLNQSGKIYHPFYSEKGLASECPRIFGEIHNGERIEGHFAIMLFDTALQKEDLACAGILEQALEMLYANRASGVFANQDESLKDLLEPNVSWERRTAAVTALQKGIHGKYAVMVTRIGNTAAEHAYAAMRAGEISDNYYGTAAVDHHGCIVILLGSFHGASFNEEERNFLQRTAESLKHAGKSGVSGTFDNLLDLASHYQEARLASKCAEGQLTFFTENLSKEIICAICPHIGAEILVPSVLSEMQEYDRKHETDLFHTLQIYSFTMHDKQKTAGILHIHRNTLLYRLNRISELFDLRTEDEKTALEVLNGYQILDHARDRRGSSDCPLQSMESSE